LRRGAMSVALCTTRRKREATAVVLPSLRYSLLRRFAIGMNRESDDLVVQALRAQTVPILYGKPSYLLALMQIDKQYSGKPSRIAARAILVSGENLFSNHRRLLEDWFDCRVYNAYASAEGGLIAVDCHEGQRL